MSSPEGKFLLPQSIESWGLRHYDSTTSSKIEENRPQQGWRDRLSSKSALETWEFQGWGHYDWQLHVSEDELHKIEADLNSHERVKLTEWEATAICGNDILSSCLYVVGLVTISAGKAAPLCLLLVSLILYCFRFMYGEAITALPMNGGSYNILINTTGKGIASIAATFALVSYIATGVVSATSSIAYLQNVVTVPQPMVAIITLLFFFAVLSVMGIKESAFVAQLILLIHVVTLITLCTMSLVHFVTDPSILLENLRSPYPDVEIGGVIQSGSLCTALFFGYSSAILGVSGYESSSQFVQSQAPGVFLKTLRNMWVGSFIFNPLISLLALAVLPLQVIVADESTVLARMASATGGRWLEMWISIDAFIVLSGALLTGYIGVTGLIQRMASDRCLPQFLLRRNKWRGTTHNIIFGYFLLSSFLVLILKGDVEDLSGVYSFAFLSVLTMFSIGVMLLKFKRPSLPRDVEVSWSAVFLGFFMLSIALLGNLMGSPEVLAVFTLYVAAAGALVLSMFQWTKLLRFLMIMLRNTCPCLSTSFLQNEITSTQRLPAVFFCKSDDVYVLNKALLYVTANEQTQHLIIVHVYDKKHPIPPFLQQHIKMFDEMYPRIRCTFLTVESTFGPALIEWLSRELNVPKNNMFLTAPDSTFKYKLDKLGGARIITH